jgi:CBS domain containing-hemolysin-like protein
LRDFSRSKLDDICRRRGRESRFGVILKHHRRALLAVDWLLVLVTLLMTGLLFSDRQWWPSTPMGAAGWLAVSGELLAVACIYLSALLVLPWTLARIGGERYLFAVWPLIAVLTRICKPCLWATSQMDKFLHRLSGLQEPDSENEVTIAQEIMSVVDEGQRDGLLESAAGTMIHRVMELQKEDTAAVMTPRTDMFCIPADASLEEARERLLEAGHTRVPVIGASTDDIVGILYAKDLLKYLDARNGEAVSLRNIVREPFYVPETMGIDTLLENMKHKHVHMAIVLDEYGGVAGLVTMEDVLEEIVGEIADEYDKTEETGIIAIERNVIEVDARVHIDDLNEQFRFGIPEDGDFDTIGGFVLTQLACIPHSGDDFTWKNLRVKVLDADKRSVKRLLIEVDETLIAADTES